MTKKFWFIIYLGLFFTVNIGSSYCLEYQGQTITPEAISNLPPEALQQLPPDLVKSRSDASNEALMPESGQNQETQAQDNLDSSFDLKEIDSLEELTMDGDKEEKDKDKETQEDDLDDTKKLGGALGSRGSIIERQYRHGYSSLLAGQLSQFGYGIFNTATAKPSSLAVPDSNYIIGTGDNLIMRVWGTSMDAVYPVVVDREGIINIPKLGPIPVAGVKYGEIESVVKKEAEKYIQGINISITLSELKSLEIYVVGEVNSPGLHMLPAFSTIFDALLHANGVKKTGTLRDIKLYRNEKKIEAFDLYDLLLAGNRKSDRTLQNKDVIFVGEIGKTAAVAGAVNNQGIFEITGKKSLKDLVTLAGGVLPQAFGDRIYLRRFNDNKEFVVRDIDTKKMSDAWNQIQIKDGDLLELNFMGSSLPYVVRISGNVWKSDVYNYQPGMRLSQILTSPDILMPDTLTDFALIFRYTRDSTRTRPMKFPLSKVFSGEYDAPLDPYDKIVILSRKQIGIKENFTLKGAIWKPGLYTFQPGLKLKDALALAGGTTNEARIDKIELSRQIKKGDRFETNYLELDLELDKEFSLQPNDSIFIPLLRDYAIRLEGNIHNPKVFKYYAGMNLSDILISKELTVPEDILKPKTLLDFGLIYRYDGKTTRTKPIRFPLQNVFKRKYDIKMEPLDRVVILSMEEIGIRETFTINGAVWKGGEFTYQPGIRLKEALALAGGITFGGGSERIEIARQTLVGDKMETVYLLKDAQLHEDFLLGPYDSILVPRIKDATKISRVTLSGEVRYPGTYAIRENEKISDLIVRAGGFTEDAYFYGAKYTSEDARKIQQKSVDTMIEKLELSSIQTSSEMAQSAVSMEDAEGTALAKKAAQEMLVKLKEIRAEGRVTIKLAELDYFKDSVYDFRLEDGDTIQVPKKPMFVSVIGSVYSAGSFLYESGQKVDNYLKKSGGPTKTADKKYTYLLKANGEIISMAQHNGFFSKFGDTGIQAGDTIVVPENLDRISALRMFKDITDVVFKIATTAGIAFAI